MSDAPMGVRRELPMFPLVSVTSPGSALPLQVFEPRYVEMLRRCLDDDGLFGTVLIERGSEVGGGDERSLVGSFIAIASAEQTPIGRWAVLGVATERLRVVEWLPDDPHPSAIVETFPDVPADDRTPGLLALAATEVRRWLRRAAELGIRTPDPEVELPGDPSLVSHQLCVLSPLGPLDRQFLLCCDGPSARADALLERMEGQFELLEARFGS